MLFARPMQSVSLSYTSDDRRVKREEVWENCISYLCRNDVQLKRIDNMRRGPLQKLCFWHCFSQFFHAFPSF